MAKLVDAPHSKCGGREVLQVQILLGAHRYANISEKVKNEQG